MIWGKKRTKCRFYHSRLGKTKVKGVLVGKVGIGGNMDQYIVSIFYDSFTEMMANEPAIQKELAALELKPLTGVVSSRKSEVLIQLPELSLERTTP